MSTITIPKKVTKGEELVVVSRKEYEAFSHWQKTFGRFKEFTPTAKQKKDLLEARKDYKKGNFLTINELKRKVEAQSKK